MKWYQSEGVFIIAGLAILAAALAWIVPACNDDARLRERTCIEAGGSYIQNDCYVCPGAK